MPRALPRRLLAALVGALLPVALAGCGLEPVWFSETLDGHRDLPIAGQVTGEMYDMAAVLYGGAPHVFYYDGDHLDLRHAWWNGVRWRAEALDGHAPGGGRTIGSVGRGVSAAIYGGAPHVFYRDSSLPTWRLKHAWYTAGIGWSYEILEGLGGKSGSTADSSGHESSVMVDGAWLHVFHYDVDVHALRHAYHHPAFGWNFEQLDGDLDIDTGAIEAHVGSPSAAALFAGAPHVFYGDATNGDLRHGWWTGARWRFETLDGNGFGPGRTNNAVASTIAALTYGGTPHVFYYETEPNPDGNLRHAWWTGATWAIEVLDGDGGTGGRQVFRVGADPAAAIVGASLEVWYWNLTFDDLRHARWNGAGWTFETVDGDHAVPATGRILGPAGVDNAVVVTPDGHPHVFHSGAGKNWLRHSWW